MSSILHTRRSILVSSALGLSTVVLATPVSRLLQSDVDDAVRIEDYGGRSGQGHDNGPALRRALAIASERGLAVRLGAGTYEVASDRLLRDGAIRRPTGVALVGEGRTSTTVQVTGATVINQLFDARDARAVLTRDIRFIGNGIRDDSAPYAGALMIALLSTSGSQDMTDIYFENCDIVNFASAAWLHIENQSASHAISGCGSIGCNWISRPGASPAAGEITVPGHFIYFNGHRGPIEKIVVDDHLMDAAHVKGGVGIVGNVAGGRIHIRDLRDAGQGIAHIPSGPDGPGSYALLLYQTSAGAPRGLSVEVDRLANPYSVGIYSAGAKASRFRIGRAFGQRDTRDATLFKGILAIMGGEDIEAHIEDVEDSNRVVMISIDGGQNLGTAAENANIAVHLGNVVSRPGARDITIDAGGSARAGGVRISGRRSGRAAVGVYLHAGPGVTLQDIDLSGLESTGAATPVAVSAAARKSMHRVTLER